MTAEELSSFFAAKVEEHLRAALAHLGPLLPEVKHVSSVCVTRRPSGEEAPR